MKTIYKFLPLYLILLTLLPGISLAQQKSKIIKSGRVYYDFEKKQLCENVHQKDLLIRPLLVKEGKEIQMVITKFNPLKYSIIIEDTAYNMFSSNINDFMKIVNLPDTTFINQFSITKPQKGKNLPTACSSYKTIISVLDDLNNSYSSYTNYTKGLNRINDVYLKAKLLKTYSPSDIQGLVIDSIFDTINPLVPNVKRINSIKDIPDTTWFRGIEEAFAQKVLSYSESLIKLEELLKDDSESCIALEIKMIYEAKLLLKEFEMNRKYKVLPAFNKTLVIYTHLTDWLYNEPILITRSYTVSKDMRQIKIYIKEKGSDTKQLYDVINIKMTRGFKIDVSGGLFVSGLYDSKFTLYSKDSIYTSQFIKYDSVPTITDTLKTGRFTAIYPQDNSKISFGGMVYLNAHTQNACFVNYGVYLGIGALFNDQTRWTGSMGGSIILGRSQHFIIHFGVALAQVTRLSEPYKTRVFYEKTFDEVPTINVWKPSYLLGFAWQIGK